MGCKRKDEGGVKTQMSLFSKSKLMEVAKERGYVSDNAVCFALSPVLGVSKRVVHGKLRKGSLTKEECEVIGSFFEMTMKEYYDVFMSGLFQEDSDGHYVCHIENPYVHLHSEPSKSSPQRNRQRMQERILEEIEEIE